MHWDFIAPMMLWVGKTVKMHRLHPPVTNCWACQESRHRGIQKSQAKICDLQNWMILINIKTANIIPKKWAKQPIFSQWINHKCHVTIILSTFKNRFPVCRTMKFCEKIANILKIHSGTKLVCNIIFYNYIYCFFLKKLQKYAKHIPFVIMFGLKNYLNISKIVGSSKCTLLNTGR